MLIKQNNIINIINIVIVIFIAYFSVQLLWLLLLDNTNNVVKNNYNTNKKYQEKSVIFEPIFGNVKVVNVVKKVVKRDLAVTKLNIKLKGIWLDSADGDNKYALITINNKDKIYELGDKISSLATIVNINSDHIIINRSGNLESLYLRDKNKGKKSSANTIRINNDNDINNKNIITPRLSSNDRRKLQNIRKKLKTNPWQLSQIMRINPYYRNNKLKGFKIRPGKEANLFNKLNLHSGDIVYKINGNSLDFKNLTKVLNTVLTNNTIVIDLYRNQDSLSLTLKL